MIAVDFRQVENTEASLRACKRKMEQFCESADQTAKRLDGITGFQDIRRSLAHVIWDMEEETVLIKQMGEILHVSMDAYARRELSLADHADELAVLAGLEMGVGAWKVPGWAYEILR